MATPSEIAATQSVQPGIASAEDVARNPYLFVVGCPRSGTTLLQRILDHHPMLAVANDTHFIPRVLEKMARGSIEDATCGRDIPLTPDLVEGVRSYHRFGRLGLDATAVEAAAARSDTYSQFVSALYWELARSHNKPLAGEKTPDYVRRLPFLHALFPSTRSVHIIRDGRDVALSLLEWANENKGPGKLELWRTEPVAVCALWWRWLVTSGREAGKDLATFRYCEVRYEQLVSYTEETLREVTAFLGLSFAPEMLTYHVGKKRSQRGLSAKAAWLPPTARLRDWQTQMNDRDIELFESLAGDLLRALGYRLAVDTTTPAVSKTADSCCAWWKEHFARDRTLPCR